MGTRRRRRFVLVLAALLLIAGALLVRELPGQGVSIGTDQAGDVITSEEVSFRWIFWSVRDGRARYCWAKDMPAACGQFEDDEAVGLWTYWWPDGSLRGGGAFVEGEQDGPWLLLDDHGRDVSDHSAVPAQGEHRSLYAHRPGAAMPATLASGVYRRGERLRDLTSEERSKLGLEHSSRKDACTCSRE